MNRMNNTIVAFLAAASLSTFAFADALTTSEDKPKGDIATTTGSEGLGAGDIFSGSGPDVTTKPEAKPLIDNTNLGTDAQSAKPPAKGDAFSLAIPLDLSKPLFDINLGTDSNSDKDPGKANAFSASGSSSNSLQAYRRNGDINHDGIVDMDDLMMVIADWGKHTGQASPADVAPDGGDGKVDVNDLIVVLMNWGG
jgi:hypothetical protein